MELNWKWCIDADALTDFVNSNGISKENIQTIFRTTNDCYCLFWWEQRGADNDT